MLFPIMLVVILAIRKLLDRYFTRQELKSLDDILPEFKRKEMDEFEETESDTCEGPEPVEGANPEKCMSPDGQADLQVTLVFIYIYVYPILLLLMKG